MMLQQIANAQRMSTIALSTGVILNFAEQGDIHGETVILLHGYTDSWFSYSRVLPLLSPSYRVFALDLRGHGNSGKVSCCYTMNDFVADVIAFMDAKSIATATIVGHSMGTMIAQLVAIQHPERVSRLVLNSSMIASNEGMEEFNANVQNIIDPIDPAFVRDFQTSTLFRSIPPEFLERAIVESLKVPAHVWRQTFASFVKQDTTADLSKITVPTLILWGDQDLISPRHDQDMLCQFIPNTTLHIYEQTGHALHWEQPERFVADLEQFLRRTKLQALYQRPEHPVLICGSSYVY